jgi:hypothetical protein
MSGPPPEATLVLRSPQLEVVVLPGKGADIYAIVDRESGIDVLFKPPWGWRDPCAVPPSGDSAVDWLARYPGGWQLLVPNAGPAREHAGVVRGYHGEASVSRWAVAYRDANSARLSVELVTAPLRLERTVTVDGATLEVEDRIRNTSAAPVPVMWVQHPAFGAPFVDGRCRLESNATAVVAARGYPPVSDMASVPGPAQRRSVFAGMSAFAGDPWFAISSPSAGFGIRVTWDSGVLPYAWLWQEVHNVAGFPWFGRAYALAVEPANVLPDHDLPDAPVLPAAAEWRARVTLGRYGL